MTLYAPSMSPCAQKVRIVLGEKDLQWAFRHRHTDCQATLRVVLEKNGEIVELGAGTAVWGHPAASVAMRFAQFVD